MTGAFAFGDLSQALLAAKAQGVVARQFTTAPLEGRLFLLADGRRLDAAGRPAPLGEAELAQAATRLGAARRAGLITREDAYYFGHHEPVALPVYRVELSDGVRFYLDPKSGGVLSRVDQDRKSYRWLFSAAHRLDFVPGFDRGGGWAAAMVFLLIFAAAGVATGVWLGWRRVRSDLGGLRRRLMKKAPKPG
jgi:hypothetical protein